MTSSSRCRKRNSGFGKAKRSDASVQHPRLALGNALDRQSQPEGSATVWEISTKVRLGKLPDAATLEAGLLHYIHEAGYTLLSISPAHALRAGRLPGKHRDPFDRMLAAQALALDIPILSTDPQLDSFGVHRIW